MTRVAILVVIFFLMRLPLAGAAEPALQGAALEREVDRLFSAMLNTQRKRGAGGATAVSVALGANGSQWLAKGYGAAGPGTSASAHTRYPIASITKQFTAAVVLQALESGTLADRHGKRLTLATDIRDVFSDIDHWVRDGGKPIRLRNLLGMTSNLPNLTKRPPALVDPWGGVDSARLLREVKKYRPRGWPDTFEYSNTDYFLLAEIIDRAGPTSRSNYRAAMQELFLKAGMTATDFYSGGASEPLAVPNTRRKPAFTEASWLKGSADVVSTTIDLFKWTTAFMEARVLSPKLRDTMLAEWARVGPSVYYGMGWFIEHRDGFDLYTHTGSFPGYTGANLIARSTSGHAWWAVSILTNGEEVDDLDVLAEEIVRLMRGG